LTLLVPIQNQLIDESIALFGCADENVDDDEDRIDSDKKTVMMMPSTSSGSAHRK
jgi:hypothetical protein